MIDNAIAFNAGAAAFIVANPITLAQLAQSMPVPPGVPNINNLRTGFTLTTDALHGLPVPGALPKLRMQPVGGPAIVPLPPPGGFLTTIDALYCHASVGGTPLNALPYCDINSVPGAADALTLFTTGMNGCSLVVLSAVAPGAAALAPGFLRVVHDHDHRDWATWNAAGYTVRFAAYENLADAGVIPGGLAPAPVVVTYNPHNYPWNMPVPGQVFPGVRVATNFLRWNGANWTFNSRHYVDFGGVPFDIDDPLGAGATSTQSVNI